MKRFKFKSYHLPKVQGKSQSITTLLPHKTTPCLIACFCRHLDHACMHVIYYPTCRHGWMDGYARVPAYMCPQATTCAATPSSPCAMRCDASATCMHPWSSNSQATQLNHHTVTTLDLHSCIFASLFFSRPPLFKELSRGHLLQLQLLLLILVTSLQDL